MAEYVDKKTGEILNTGYTPKFLDARMATPQEMTLKQKKEYAKWISYRNACICSE